MTGLNAMSNHSSRPIRFRDYLPEVLRGAAEYKDFLTGFLLLLLLIFLPNGIVGFVRQHLIGVLPAKTRYSSSGRIAMPAEIRSSGPSEPTTRRSRTFSGARRESSTRAARTVGKSLNAFSMP